MTCSLPLKRLTVTYRTTRLLALVAIVLAAAGVVGTPAFAHAGLKSSNPKDDSTVKDSISAIELVFTEDINPRYTTVVVTGPGGAKVADGKPQVKGDTVTQELKADLANGRSLPRGAGHYRAEDGPDAGASPGSIDLERVMVDGALTMAALRHVLGRCRNGLRHGLRRCDGSGQRHRLDGDGLGAGQQESAPVGVLGIVVVIVSVLADHRRHRGASLLLLGGRRTFLRR
jgi:methionine-rich copper-binding protein CopC